MLAVSRIELYAHLLIAVPLVLAGLFVLVLAVVVAVRWYLWRCRQRHAEAQAQAAKLRPDGRPYPPAARGMCDACRQAHETVYHLKSGRRLCAACLEHEGPTETPPQ